MAGGRPGDESELQQLADQQAALRRVATLVAQGAPAETLFAVVAEQVAEVLGVSLVSIVRYEPDGTATERASFSPRGTMFRVGSRWSLDGTNVVAQIRDSLRPARIDDYAGLTGEIAERVRTRRHPFHRRQPDRGRGAVVGSDGRLRLRSRRRCPPEPRPT